MGKINHKALSEINLEYLNLCGQFRFFTKFQTLVEAVHKGTFFESIFFKLNRNKFYDNVKIHKIKFDQDITNKKIPRTVVYMCVVGNYDRIYEPVVLMDNTDYVIITDCEIDDNSVWKKIPIDKNTFPNMTSAEINRYYKLHPHVLFPTYEYSIYIDGNIRITEDLTFIISEMDEKKKNYAVFRHPDRDCVYTEYNYLTHLKRFYKEQHKYKRQIDAYKKAGFPKHFGLYENTILIRKHVVPSVIKLMEEWWKELTTFSFRDQLSFPFVMWKNNWKEEYMLVLGYNLKDCEWIRYYSHVK